MATIPAQALAQDYPTAPPSSDWSVTGSAAVASQYRFRGIAESDNQPVVQGAISVAHASGFYVSAWGSTAQTGNSPVAIGGSELDLFGGYTHAIGHSAVVFDGGLEGYVHAGMPAGNHYEIYGSLAETLGPATARFGAAFAPAQNVFNATLTSTARDNLYVYAEATAAIPHSPITLHSHLAHTGGGFDYAKPYLDYSLGATAKWKRLSLDLSLVGTNVGRTDIARSGLATGAAGTIDPLKIDAFYRQGKPVGVVSLTASF